jgi:uncharacterized SAM-binding protein YcdF (DUF218 family)
LYVYLSKILPVFVMPMGIVFALGLVVLILLRYNKRRTATGFLMLALAILYVSSLPLTAKYMYQRLESQHLPVPTEQVPNGGCIIMLGGVLSAPLPPRVDVNFHDGIDRVYKTAELYRAGKAPYVIVTGGNQPWSVAVKTEADYVRELLVEWGVPEDAIFLEGSSRNTRENALYSKNLINAINCQDPLLVTSAAHMARAVAAFNGVGISVTPISTDVAVTDRALPSIMDFVPNAGALATTSAAIREWIGQKVYSWNGWD